MSDFSFPSLESAVVGFLTDKYSYDPCFFDTAGAANLVLNLDAKTVVGLATQWSDTSNTVILSNAGKESFFADALKTIVFNGNNGIGTIAASNSLNLTSSTNFTIETLLYYVGPSGNGNFGQIITQDVGGSDPLNWQFRISNSNNTVQFLYQTGPSRGTAATVTSLSSLIDGTWNHIAVTYDGNNLKIYINGDLSISAPVPIIYSTLHPTSIGSFYLGGFTDRLNAKIAFIRLYKDRYLSEFEIFKNANNFYIPNNDGTVPAGNLILGKESSFPISPQQPGYFTGRRPQNGQLYPRGVYNK